MSTTPWTRSQLLSATLIFTLLWTFLVSMGLFLTQVTNEYLEPWLCDDRTSLASDSYDYSYKPGQRGTAVNYQCCDKKGRCGDDRTSAALAILFGVTLVPMAIVSLVVVNIVSRLRTRYGYRPVLYFLFAAALLLIAWLVAVEGFRM